MIAPNQQVQPEAQQSEVQRDVVERSEATKSKTFIVSYLLIVSILISQLGGSIYFLKFAECTEGTEAEIRLSNHSLTTALFVPEHGLPLYCELNCTGTK